MIPLPHTPDAPKWSSSAPDELSDFLWVLEQMFKEGGITDDEKKIRWAAMYPDKEDAADWRGFEEYKGSSWEEFKRRLLEEYSDDRPLKRIRDLSREFRPIGIDDEDNLRVFVRRFRAAARECMEAPALMSNWGAIELFKKTLTKNFRDTLVVRMISAARLAGMQTDERLTLETVMELAVMIATQQTVDNFDDETSGGREMRVKGGDASNEAGLQAAKEFLEFKESINARLAAMEDRMANLEKGLASSVGVYGKRYVGAAVHQPRGW